MAPRGRPLEQSDSWAGGTKVGGLALVVIALLALAGWLTGSRALNAFDTRYVPMAPHTAILFVELGASLWLLTTPSRYARMLARCAITASFIVAGAHVGHSAIGADFVLDQWMFAAPDRAFGLVYGRMAFVTALSFALACPALLAQSFPQRPRFAADLAGALAVIVTLIGLVFVLGYVYQAPLLYTSASVPMALPTAIAFVILGLSIAVPAALQDHAARREREEERAHRNLARQALVFETIGDAVLVMDLTGRILDWNPAASRMFGYSKADIVGRLVTTIHDPRLQGRLEETIQESLRRNHRWAGELPFQRKDGTRGVADVVVVAQLDQRGEPAAWIGVNRDVTERRRADAALADSRALLAAAEELAHVGSWALDVATGDLTWSDELFRILGQPPGTAAVSTDWFLEHMHPDDRANVRAAFKRLVEVGVAAPVECRVIRPDGTVRTIQARGRMQRDAATGAARVLGSAQDVTERVAAERALQHAHSMMTALLEASPVAILALDDEARITIWNPAAERLFGWARHEVMGGPLPIVSDEYQSEYTRLREAVLHGRPVSGVETRRRRKDGVLVDVLLSSAPLRDGTGRVHGVVSLVMDVTERKELEGQLRQSQRLEAVGQLAGGIAHDFNNLLTVITSYAALLLQDLGPSDPKRVDVGEIARAADRAAALTQQLLAFGRRQLLQPRVLDVNHTVREMENMLRRLLTPSIDLVTDLDARLHAVRADPGQLEQVLMNLVVNARDAMPDGGTLTIETGNVAFDAAEARHHPTVARPGEYVRLAVRDTGHGMDAATQARVFEPFFTTKEAGKGTGLGLSTVYGIVSQSGGHVSCRSQPGLGTTFEIYLPRVDEAALLPTDMASRPVARPAAESVLVVEDDEAVRSVARRILVAHGYTVLEAANGVEALETYDRAVAPIDLIVTDMVMPEMDGSELVRQLYERHASACVLFMSGYAGDAALCMGAFEPGSAFIEKPFAPEALVAKVRQMLDEFAPNKHPTRSM